MRWPESSGAPPNEAVGRLSRAPVSFRELRSTTANGGIWLGALAKGERRSEPWTREIGWCQGSCACEVRARGSVEGKGPPEPFALSGHETPEIQAAGK